MFELIQETHYAFKCYCVPPQNYTYIIKYRNLGSESRGIKKIFQSPTQTNLVV